MKTPGNGGKLNSIFYGKTKTFTRRKPSLKSSVCIEVGLADLMLSLNQSVCLLVSNLVG